MGVKDESDAKIDRIIRSADHPRSQIECSGIILQANKFFRCLMSAELPGVDYVEDVLRELEKEIETVKQDTKANHKVAMVCSLSL